MNLPETGDITTPIDDPCQFNPAWRSIVAGYLFSVGIRTKDDLASIARSGSVTVTLNVTQEDPKEPPKPAKGKKGKAPKAKKKRKTVEEQKVRRIHPFYENPEYRILAADPWIILQLRMFNDEIDGKPLADECVPLKLATRWYMEQDTEAAMKKRLEPMLLTTIGMDIITLDLTGLPSLQPAIEAYERLFFNCRIDNFELNPSKQLIQRFAMPWGPLKTFLRKFEEVDEDGFVIGDGRPLAKDSDVWRAIGATMGYEALMYYWRWDERAHGIQDHSIKRMIEISWKAAVGRLFSDLYTGNIAHEDAAKVLSAYTAQTKFLSDDGKEGGGEEDTTKAMLSILYAMAPKMREITAGGEGTISDNVIQSRIAAQMAIDKQGIQDAGKEVSDAVIDAQIDNAIEGV